MRVIGTAGHVDHGKSTLIQALTGIDPDRLQEEKERGMTIDLGFAWLRLPNGVEVSMVDVPGHERFIHNMLAGVGGIDIALLVVAADEGIMPQTREHLAILDLLAIQNGAVALTKRDLVDDEWLELVTADVEEALRDTSLAGAPIVPCSSVTGHGLDQLKLLLQDLLSRERTRPSSGRPRLPIDRVFTVAGFGTVVTGTLLDGELRLGQELEVQPGGLKTRVRGLQSHKKKVETVPAGTRTAVNLGGMAVEKLRRGQVLVQPGTFRPTVALDARLRLVKDARPLKHNAEVTFHTGAAETLARVTLLETNELQPGEEGWIQLRLQDEVALAKGDLFVLRLPSPSMTVGGGTVVEPHARRHRRRQATVLERLAVLARGTPEEVLLQQLRAREPADLDSLVRRAGLPPDEARPALQRLVAAGELVALDGVTPSTPVRPDPQTPVPPEPQPPVRPEPHSPVRPESVEGQRAHASESAPTPLPNGTAHPPLGPRTFLISAPGWEALTDRVQSILGAYHQTYPLRRGFPKEELRARLGFEPRLFGRVLERLQTQAIAAEDGPFVRLTAHEVRFTPEQERAAVRVLDVLREAGASPPDRPEWEQALRVSPELTDALLARGALVEVAPNLVYDRGTLDRLVAQVRQAIQTRGPLTVAEIRDLLDASRKYVLALVTYTDEHKITRRQGDHRLLY